MKQSTFRDLVASFVQAAWYVAGVRTSPASGRFESRGALWDRFEHLPLDPEGLLVLDHWVKDLLRESEDDRTATHGRVDVWRRGVTDWMLKHGRLLIPKRVDALAQDLGITPPTTPRIKRRVELDTHEPSGLWIRTRLAFGLGPRAAVATVLAASKPRWVSYEEIARDSCLPLRSVREATMDLGAVGYLAGIDHGGIAYSLSDPIDSLARPRSKLTQRSWRDLVTLIAAADRELGCDDEDPLGLDDPQGDRGPLKRFRQVAADAGFHLMARAMDPFGVIGSPDPNRLILDEMERLLGTLEGW